MVGSKNALRDGADFFQKSATQPATRQKWNGCLCRLLWATQSQKKCSGWRLGRWSAKRDFQQKTGFNQSTCTQNRSKFSTYLQIRGAQDLGFSQECMVFYMPIWPVGKALIAHTYTGTFIPIWYTHILILASNHIPRTEKIGLIIITTAKISDKFSRESP